MARRTRVHSRDLQPLLATPKTLLAVARVQRFDWPIQFPTTEIDELARKLHVGITSETPTVSVTVEGFDVTHNTFAALTGSTGNTFVISGASITELKNVDVIGQIRDTTTLGVVNTLYVRRGIVTGLDASFGVKSNSTVSYTIQASSKKEFKQPVYYQLFNLVTATGVQTLTNAPTYLTRTSGYIIDAYRTATGVNGATAYLDEGVDFTVTGSNINFNGNSTAANDTVWVTYCSPITTKTFEALDNTSPAAIQGKYVPTKISVSTIPRVQSVTIRASLTSEEIAEMGSLGKPIGYEVGIPSVTGDITVLKTDDDLMALLEGVSNTTVENDLAFAVNTLPLKVQLLDPANPNRVVLTYYVPSITINQESDTDSVNQSMNETFSWQSTTGELIIMSGQGVY